jgi:transaldolase
MKLFIDTGSVAEAEEIAGWGVSPAPPPTHRCSPRRTHLRRGRGHRAEEMVAEGRALARIHPHVVVKVPFSRAGLTATRELTSEGIPVNMTLVFSAPQALLSAEAGATYVSCFVGRVDDISVDSASIRNPMHVVTAATLGCPVATLPAKVLRQMLEHPLTTAGIERFTADWQSRPEFADWLHGLVLSGRPSEVARSSPGAAAQ